VRRQPPRVVRERDAIVGQVDRRRQRGDGGGDEQHGDADADLDFGEAAQAQDGGAGIEAQPLDDAEVHSAQAEQAEEEQALGDHHDAVGGAVESRERPDVEERHHDAGGRDHADAEHRQ
jgi:hypothetical protein